MVCVCTFGGGLSSDLQSRLDVASQFHMRGDVVSAVEIYRSIIAEKPNQPDALHGMGLAAFQAGKLGNALLLIEGALKERPDFARAWYNRSLILKAAGRGDEALHSARLAVQSDPNLAEAWNILGQLLKDKSDYAEAGECYQRAIALQPNNAHFHGNMAALLFAAGDLRNGYKAGRQAEMLDPEWPPMPLGNILRSAGYPLEAVERFKRVRELQPHFIEATNSEAMARLQAGDMERGWRLWEQRSDLEPGIQMLPMWQGQHVEFLLVYEDQGLGDAIQFARYLPLLKNRADHIRVKVKEPLLRLFQESFPENEFITHDPDPQTAMARCRLSSLPFFFDTRLGTIPPAPYLSASLSRRMAWRAKLSILQGPHIGIVWAGNVNFRNDWVRSIQFPLVKILFEAGKGHLISMQKEREATDFFDAGPELHDFADTAALISELDLVISVDTAVAHLAGALGKPVWIPLPFDADWRWLLGREDSPWYATARLFRQKTNGDWSPVLQDVAECMKRFIAGNKSVLLPSSWREQNLHRNPFALDFPK